MTSIDSLEADKENKTNQVFRKFSWTRTDVTDIEPPRISCTTFHRYPIFSKSYTVLCKVYTDYCGTSEIEHGLCACTVDNPRAKARGLSLRTGAQTMLYLSLVAKLFFQQFYLREVIVIATCSNQFE